MTTDERQALIAQYQAGVQAVQTALDDISSAELDVPEAVGEWTPRQIVHHLADSETRSVVRLRRLLAEDNPTIVGYDQEAYAQVLHYDRGIDASLALFAAVRASNGELLERMTDADWQRSGSHTEDGTYSAETWLAIYGVHADEHAEQIRRARAAFRTDQG